MKTIKNRNDLVVWITLNVPSANLGGVSVGEAATWFVVHAQATCFGENFDIKEVMMFLSSYEDIIKDIDGYTEEYLASYEGIDEDLIDDLKEHFGL